MAAVPTLILPYGAPVIVVGGSKFVHLPSMVRLGRGTHSRPLSSYFKSGTVPVHWTSMCNEHGTVVFFCALLDEDLDGLCPLCGYLTLRLS